MEFEVSQTVAYLGVLCCERGLVKIPGQMQIQQPLLLAAGFVQLLLEVHAARPGLFMLVRGHCQQRLPKPVLHGLGLADTVEQRQHFLIDLLFTKPDTWMVFRGVPSAPVICIAFARRLLFDDLTGHGTTAMTACDQFTGVSQFVGFVDFVAEKRLDAVKLDPFH